MGGMHILYAVHHLPPRHTGGAENRAYRTVRWMASHGHRVSIICFEGHSSVDGPWEDSFESGVFVRRLTLERFIDTTQIAWTYDEPRIETHFLDFLKENQPEIVHVIGGYLVTAGGIRAALSANVPVVVTLTDFWFLCPRITLLKSDGSVCPAPPVDGMGCVRCLAEESRRYRLFTTFAPRVSDSLWRHVAPRLAAGDRAKRIDRRRTTLRDALLSSEVLICPSEFLRRKYVEQGVPAQKCLVLRQGHALAGASRPSRSPAVPFTIGYVGQIKWHKGLDVLLEAARRLLDRGLNFRVAVYGNSAESPEFVSKLKAQYQGSWLEWRGIFGAEETANVMAGFDVLVVPSRWYENSPNVIVEAQVFKVPIIATRLGGMAELVRDEIDGLLFELNNAQDLARQLQRALEDRELLRRLSANAPLVKSLDMEMHELCEIYEAISQGNRGSRHSGL
jgi:glycosyltransferase involved in cell wall biosynthesis